MQLVIDIDDEIYDRYLNYTENYVDFMFSGTEEKIVRAFRKGTPLPKGHGRLIDANAFDDRIKDSLYLYGTYEREVCSNFFAGISATLKAMKEAPTVIEAERTEE